MKTYKTKNLIKAVFVASLFSLAVNANAADKYELYFAKGAASLAPRIVINELGLSVDYKSVDLPTHKTQSGDDYYKINPTGMVPALKLPEGEILTETSVIMQYLSDKEGSGKLLPLKLDIKRYRVLEATNFVATETHKAIGRFFTSSEGCRQSGVDILFKKLEYLDKKLDKKNYLVDNSFSIADAYLFTNLFEIQNLAKIKIDNYKNLVKYYKNLEKRESIRLTLTQEGLDK